MKSPVILALTLLLSVATTVPLAAAADSSTSPVATQDAMTEESKQLLSNQRTYRNLLLRTRDALHTMKIADSDLHKLANLLVQALAMKQGIQRQVTVLRKRACAVLDLGGHCDAEYGAELLDQINHMLKPGGPGRR